MTREFEIVRAKSPTRPPIFVITWLINYIFPNVYHILIDNATIWAEEML